MHIYHHFIIICPSFNLSFHQPKSCLPTISPLRTGSFDSAVPQRTANSSEHEENKRWVWWRDLERSGEIWRSSWSSSDWPKFQKTMCLCYVLSLISVSNVSIPRFHDLWHIFEPDSCVLFSFFPWKNWKTPEKLINVGTMGGHPALKQVDLWREEPGQWWHRPGAKSAVYHLFVEVESWWKLWVS